MAKKQVAKKDNTPTSVETPEMMFEKAKVALHKKYKTNKIFSMASKDFINFDVPRVSYAELGVDAILYGGAPQGRIIKIAGKFSSGKSTLLAHYVAIKTTILRKRVFLADYEYAWTREWLQAIGADVSLVTVGYPETLEEAFDMLEMMYLTGYFDDVLFESLSASSPEAEVEADNDEWTQGLKARLANKFFRKLESHQNSFVGRSVMPPTFQFTGHLFARLHDKFTPEGTSGGNQQDNSSTVILHLNRSTHITDQTGTAKGEEDDQGEKDVHGFFVKVKAQKNKLAPPFKTCLYGVLNEPFRGHGAHGFFHADTIARVAEKMGIIVRNNSWYNVPGWDKGVQGMPTLHEKLYADRDVFEMVVEAIKSRISEITSSDDRPDGVALNYEARFAYLPQLLQSLKPRKPDSADEGGKLAGNNILTEKEAKAKRAERAAKKGKKK